MSSFRVQNSTTENDNSRRFSDVPHSFKRRHVNDWKLLCPRRYVLALMLFILYMIQAWRNINIIYTLAHVIVLGNEDAKTKYPSIGHWTLDELDNYKTLAVVAEVFAQFPGGLLIFIFSGHKFILISVWISSSLHMLTPVALNHHSISLLFVLISQCVVSAPIYVATFTIWKDWAPPEERTKLFLFSLYGIFVGAAATTFYPFVFPYVTTEASFYLCGTAGLLWALFWFNVTADTPQNDSLISENELLYLENNLPTDYLHKIQVKEVPWKSILFSKPILVLCLIFFKMACSIETIILSGTLFSFHLGETYNPLYFFLPFLCSFVIIIPSSAALADWLIKKFSGRKLLIRKIFLCGGFFLQCVFLFGTLSNSECIEAIFYMISYSIFAASTPGFITLALDLSPRYVSLIAGILFTFYSLGLICTSYFVDATISIFHLDSLSYIFLFDGALSLLSIIFFAMWGDAEEQLWSLTFPSNRIANDYRSYPKPDDEDNLNLVA